MLTIMKKKVRIKLMSSKPGWTLEEIAAGDDAMIVPVPISAVDAPVPPDSFEYSPSEGDAPDSPGAGASEEPQAAAISGSESCSIAAESDPGEVVLPVPSEWPSHIEGLELKLLSGRSGGHHTRATRIGVHCKCCGLFKTRSTDLQKSTLGSKAALYYIGAWLSRIGPGHRDYYASLTDCQAYKARHPD